MNTSAAPTSNERRSAGVDPAPTTDTDTLERLGRLKARRTGTPVATGPAGKRRRHAAKGSRAAALSMSLAATTGLVVSFAHADRSEAATKKATPTTVATATAKKTTTAAATTAKSFTGAVSTNKWGPVQVRVTIANGAITDVTAVQTPSGHNKSVQINSRAVPTLRSEALTAQSANIDTVSGATYTSDSYASSLQSAIDQARAAGALAAA